MSEPITNVMEKHIANVAKKPVRILHVFGNLNRGGAETFIMSVYRNIDRKKVQFDFMVHTTEKCAYDDEIEALGGRIYRVPTYSGVNHLDYKRKWGNFFENNKEHKIIHGHMTSTASIYLKIAKKYGLTTIAHSHSTSSGDGFSSKVKDYLQKPLINISDHLFACSGAAGAWCYGEEVEKKANFKVVKNAIDIEKFTFDQTSRDAKRQELNVENKFVVGHVGRFFAPKNHDFLINVFAHIHKTNHNAILLLIGDGDLRSGIEQKVKALGLESNVIFTGVREDVPELLCAMDVFVFPSLWEGVPVTLIEAQANGLRCIISDAVTDEVKIAELVETVSLQDSVEYWADKVLAHVDSNGRDDMREGVQQAGYDIKEIAAWLEEFYLGAKNE